MSDPDFDALEAAADDADGKTEKQLAGHFEKLCELDIDDLKEDIPDEDDRKRIKAKVKELRAETNKIKKAAAYRALVGSLTDAGARAVKKILLPLALLLVAVVEVMAITRLGPVPLSQEPQGLRLPFPVVDVVALADLEEKRIAFGVSAPIADAFRVFEWNAGVLDTEDGARFFTGAVLNIRELLEWAGKSAFHYRLSRDLTIGYTVVTTIPQLKTSHGLLIGWRFGG